MDEAKLGGPTLTVGWSVWSEGEGYRWNAWGPQGRENGQAATHEAATGVAKLVAQRLSKPKLDIVR